MLLLREIDAFGSESSALVYLLQKVFESLVFVVFFVAMSTTGKKPARHVYKTGAAGCGGKAAPTSAKNAGQVRKELSHFNSFQLT